MFDTIEATASAVAIPANATVNIVLSQDTPAPAGEAATVVKNDTSALVPSTTVYEKLSYLVTQNKTWEETVYKTSNEQLYAILQACYTVYVNAGTKQAAKDLNEALERLAKERAFKFLSSTHTLTKIIKCVFGADRRRASAYSIALRAANAAKKKPEDIPAFIRDSGGVEELRLAKSPNALSPKPKAAAAEQAVDRENLAVVKADVITQKLDTAHCGQKLLLVATQEEDGSVTINAVVKNDTAIRAALAVVYSQTKDKRKESEAQATVSDASPNRDALIEKAVTEALAVADSSQPA